MGSSSGQKAPSKEVKESSFKSFLGKLRKRHIIETFAGFIAGGWLLVEVVERLLVGHYKFPEASIDLTVVSIIGALLSTLIWRWFAGTEKRPGNVKVEVLLVPLVILVALAIDLNLILQMAGIPGKKLLIGIVAFMLGIAWVIFKLSQWAAITPDASIKKFDISKLAEIKPEKSIVVLPFSDLSPQKDQEYFCDGMTEEIITDLSHIHGLLVISRNSAMTFRGTQKKTSEIAKDVNVRYVLEGSVRKAGNDLKITAQLIDAINDAHLWAEKYSGTLDDVFDIQEKVSRSIVGELKLKLTQEENRKISERPVPSFYAYDCYLKARHKIYKWSEEGYDKALKYLQEGLDLAGDNSLIYGGMAYVYYSYVNMGIKSDEQYLRKAEEYANKNLEFDPKSPIGHLVLGLLQAWRGDLQNGMRRLKYALALDPNNSDTILWLAAFFSIIGKPEAAIPLIDRFLKLEPLHPMSGSLTGICQMWAGRFDLALESFHKGFQTFPDDLMTRSLYGLVLAYNRRIEEALTILSGLVKDDPKNYWYRMAYGLVSELKGQTSEILDSLQDPAFETWARRDFSYSMFMVDIYVLLGENEKAFGWLEHAVSIGYINYPFLNEHDPFLANIRNEPRFKKLMERVKYEWEHFEV
jgi:non-specific serine/threonine protein kinase